MADADVSGEVLEAEIRAGEAPPAEVPETEVPETELPETELPETELPETELPEADLPEVELSEGEVADVLSGRVIPIGAFFGGQARPAGPDAAADDDEAAVPDYLADIGRAVITWANRQHLGLTSACGICVALAVCAAAWFSGGTREDIVRGVAALWGGYVVLAAGQRLATPSVRPPAPSSQVAAKDARTGQRRRAGPVAWLAALGASLAECIVYAGLAVGATAERWAGVWTLALAVLGLVALRNLMTACSTPPGFGERSDSAFRRVSEAVLTMPVGGRVALIGIVAPIWGARVALLALLDWAIVSIGYGIAGRAAPDLAAAAKVLAQAGPGDTRSRLLRLRDDGVLSRTLGTIVRGNLLPLPPAILGLAAISALALLGLHGLPGALMIGPAIVMLLAAPGSSNPHLGRFDWLVPVLLLGSQFLYLTAIGLGTRVPGAVIFALGVALLLRYADLALPGRPVLLARPRRAGAEPAERGTSLGWEGRLLLAGLAAAMGIATFAYLALTAYLGVLICAKVMASCLGPQEEDRP